LNLSVDCATAVESTLMSARNSERCLNDGDDGFEGQVPPAKMKWMYCKMPPITTNESDQEGKWRQMSSNGRTEKDWQSIAKVTLNKKENAKKMCL
jgi:hypothetical protein